MTTPNASDAALHGPGYQVLGSNHDWWPEKAVERHMREVKVPMIVLTREDCERHIDILMESSRKAREEREAAVHAKAVA